MENVEKTEEKKKKKKKYRGSHGTVTIFLTLILVPCIIFVCAFGDVSRVMLSRSQATSAADLALYSLLSNYDEDLKEWYGLVASCDSISSFYDTTEEYFEGMMTAEGIDGTASEMISSYISSLRTGDSFADFLQVEISGETTVSAVSNSSLENEAILEDEIVEFMKYRGPVEIFSNLIDRFSDLNLDGSLTESTENEPIVEAKQEYAEAEGELLSAVLYTYLATLNYKNYYDSNEEKLSLSTLQNNYTEDLSEIREDLKDVTELITKYYSFTDRLTDLTGSFTDISSGSLPTVSGSGEDITTSYSGTTYDPDDIGADWDEENATYTLSAEDASKLVEDYKTWIANVKNSADNIYNACSGIAAPSSGTDDVNPAVYLMKMQDTLSDSDLTSIRTNAAKLMQAYAKILLALECDMDDSSKTTLESARDNIKKTWTDYLSYTAGQNSNCETVLYQYKTVKDREFNSIKNRTYMFDSEFCGEQVDINNFFSEVESAYSSVYNMLTSQISRLNTIINGGSVSYGGNTYTAKSLSELKALLEDYINKRDDWGDAAYSSNTGYAQSEQAEYSGEGEKTDELAQELAEKGVEIIDDFQERLTNIRDDLQDLVDAIDSFTYGGSKVIELTGDSAVTAAKTAVPTDYTEISTSLSQNATDAQNYASQLISPSSGSAVYTAPSTASGETGNNPDLDVDSPTFYQFMKERLGDDIDSITDAKDENDKNNEEYQEQADQEAESSKGYNTDYIKGVGSDETLPSERGTTYSATTALSGLAGIVKTLVNGQFTEIRDRLYVVEYAMDMFSYSSFNNEGMFDLNDDSSFTHANFVSNGYSYPSTAKNSWDDTSLTEVYGNQSLTNRPINNTNNQMNLAEVEYILYGKSTIEDNLTTSYKNIFAIREALNLVSGFQNFYNMGNATANAISTIATVIASATAGIVPVALTKCILIGVLATLESAHDLNRLKAGIPVTLYKSSPDAWCYAISAGSGKKASFGVGTEPVDENGIYYSDYLYLFLLLGAQSEECYTGMLTRIGHLVALNMVKQGDSGFELSKAMCYFQLTSTLRVKPLLLTLPIVDSFSVSGGDHRRDPAGGHRLVYL
ncbi:MAG: DUF5702 domain-containing protein [Clostridiales bacterium]|nr:DUF5702 domain-containing protein [Clostridiales bacterium]